MVCIYKFIYDKIIINDVVVNMDSFTNIIDCPIKEHLSYIKDNLYIDEKNNIYKKYGDFYFIIGIYMNDNSYFYDDSNDTHSNGSNCSKGSNGSKTSKSSNCSNLSNQLKP